MTVLTLSAAASPGLARHPSVETRRIGSSQRLLLALLLAGVAGCMTPLMEAAGKGDMLEASRLIDNGADVNAVNDGQDRWSALDAAVKAGHIELARMLVRRGANPNGRTGGQNMTAMDLARAGGREDIAEAILEEFEARKRSPALAERPRDPTGPKTTPAAPATSTPARRLAGKLAVLDLRNLSSDLSNQNTQYFTDVVRQETLRKEPQLDVMTRENLLVLLQATGKKLEDCEGECEIDTGRRIGADLIVSGEIQNVGTRLKISLRLHETREGRLLGSSIASGKSIDELDENAAKAADELYATVR